MVGIISYGLYIPVNRLKISDICDVWGKDVNAITSSLGVYEKAVADTDEDALTMAFEASHQAIKTGDISTDTIGSVFVGSESHPYSVNPTSTILGEFLGFSGAYISSDLQFACKAATTALMLTANLIQENKVQHGLVVGSDAAQAKPHDILEYTAGAGACAFIIGSGKQVVAEIVDSLSYSTDTPDFWRRDGMRYPAHGGRFTGEPSYFHHVCTASNMMLTRHKVKASDFDKCVFHMPNGKYPRQVATRLGFSHNQIKDSLIVDSVGNPYTASTLLGIVSTLERSKPNETIFVCSYGSGAGSDAFIIRTTPALKTTRKSDSLRSQIESKKYISYVSYLKKRGVI